MGMNKQDQQIRNTAQEGFLCRYIFLLCVIACIFSMSSCFDNEGLDFEVNETLIQEKLRERIDDYHKTRLTTCMVAILDDAENYVDTFIVNLINHDILDGLMFPEKPLKPVYPLRIVLDDSTRVLPLFMEEE
jgi:hypothetical protein